MEIDKLGPKMWNAIVRLDTEFDSWQGGDKYSWETIRAELLRMADENAQLRTVCEESELNREGIKHAHVELKRVKTELAESHETIKRLNRRVQVAEAGVVEKVKVCAPGSLGRALANAAASKAEAELAALKTAFADAPLATLVIGQSGALIVISAEDANDWGGKSVRLLAVAE